MPSQVINTLIPNDKGFGSNFNIVSYYKAENSFPILNIWTDIQLELQQQEKINAFLYYNHDLKTTDTLESISETYYNTQNYWWLILLVNQATDPFDFLFDFIDREQGIKILKSQYFPNILKQNTTSDISRYLGANNGK